MAAHFSWKGYLRLSLVSCPIHLAPATSTRERITFHLLNPKTRNRIVTRTVDAETGAEVPRGDLIRGYEFEKGRFIVVGEDEIEQLRIDSSETIDLVRFVDRETIDPVYFDTPYYATPEGKLADETFRVIRAAMADAGKAGIGRVVLAGREHPILVAPEGKGMLMMTLRPAEEVRDAAEYFSDIGDGKLDREMVALAGQIIAQKAGPFAPQELTGDRYQDALRALVAQKMKGETPVMPKAAPRPSNVVNLMDALKRSVAGEAAGKRATPARQQADTPSPPARKRKRAEAETPAGRKSAPAKRQRAS